MVPKFSFGMNRRMGAVLFTACLLAGAGVSRPAVPGGQEGPGLAAERTLAATISETRMVETVRRLVGFGTRMYGTPSNHEAAAWLAGAFREAGLEVTVRQDTPRDWYQPVTWQVRTLGDPAGPGDLVLKTTWPSTGSPSAKGEGALSLEKADWGRLPDIRQPDPGDDGRVRGCAVRWPVDRVGLAGCRPAARDVDDPGFCPLPKRGKPAA